MFKSSLRKKMNPHQNLVWMSRLILLRTHQEGIKRIYDSLKGDFLGWAKQTPKVVKKRLEKAGKGNRRETSLKFYWLLWDGARVRVPWCQMWECWHYLLSVYPHVGREVGLKNLLATKHQKQSPTICLASANDRLFIKLSRLLLWR